ncbi:MAG: phenylalanine--tRNA ligase subunit alpha [Candidatus Marinimicrobia bacterium]|nr:phenylalanine--tRNA ligase subunit alpha [Candidatus Neomarinimicrobiota bacterium]
MNIQHRIDEVRKSFHDDINNCELTPQKLEELRIKYLGKKGFIQSLFKLIPELDIPERKEFGRSLNSLKNEIIEKIEFLNRKVKKKVSSEEYFDHTLPGISYGPGRLHPVSLTMREIILIFQEIGFGIEFGPEVESDFYNFEALNFPEDHPARDMQDTFYINDKILLRTHTSPIQIRVMQSKKPPIRILAPGRVFRNESINARSYCVFHQIEGLCIDKNISFAELKGVLGYFAKRYFGKDVELRFRPSFFPFTEPSAEVDISCFICGGKGCKVCKETGWLEILGCGMVDPNVLKMVNIDPEKYSGYAFGMGLERIAMLKYGIDDIRLFYENDIRFSEQFY